MRKRTTILFTAVWLQTAGIPLVSTETPSRSPEAEQLLFQTVNECRIKNNLPALVWDQALSDIAYRHSADMVFRSFFDHVNPDGHNPTGRIHRQHRQFIGNTGENLSVIVGAPPLAPTLIAEQAMNAWLRSPAHMANILDRAFTHTGIGAAFGGVEAKVTQNFMQVRGILKEPVPELMGRDNALELKVTPFPPDSPKAQRYVLEPLQPDPEHPDQPVWPLSTRRPRVRPGKYTIQFCFPAARSSFLEVFPGPQIEIVE